MEKSKVKQIIQEEIEIFFENFKFNDSQKNKIFMPTPGMKTSAQEAIDAIEKNDLTEKGGNEGSGVNKAKNLIANEKITFSSLKRMKAFFDNNNDLYTAEKNAGKNINNSGIIQSWNLWGGDAGYSFAKANIKDENKTNLDRKKNRRLMSTNGTGNVKRLVDTTYHRKK